MKKVHLNMPDDGELRIPLHARQTVSTHHAAGLALECLHGSVWITFSGDMEDYFLAPGERLPVAGRENIVIQALEDSEIAFLHTPSSIVPAETVRAIPQATAGAWEPIDAVANCWRNFITRRSAHRLGLESAI